MTISETLLPEFDHEISLTRKTLDRIPDDKFAWAPHEKSMKLGSLAIHLAEIPSWVGPTLSQDSLDVAPAEGPRYKPPELNTRAEVVAHFDKNVAAARAALAGASDDTMQGDWSLLAGGKTLFTMPRISVIRNLVLNHTIHHRAQMGVYLRLNDLPVPSIYGPSADEGGM